RDADLAARASASPRTSGARLGCALSGGADRRRADRPEPAVVGVRVAVAGDLRGRAPPVGEVQPPMAELVEVQEADDLAPSAEEDVRLTPGAEVDHLPEGPERLRDLDHDLGVVPVRESLQMWAGAVSQR